MDEQIQRPKKTEPRPIRFDKKDLVKSKRLRINVSAVCRLALKRAIAQVEKR